MGSQQGIQLLLNRKYSVCLVFIVKFLAIDAREYFILFRLVEGISRGGQQWRSTGVVSGCGQLGSQQEQSARETMQ